MASFHGQDGWRFSVLVGRMDIRASGHECSDDFVVAVLSGEMKSGATLIVRGLQVYSVVNERLDDTDG